MPVSLSLPAVVQTAGLTSEQQKELLAMQFEQKSKLKVDREKQLELEKLQQAEKLELERQSTERMQLELEESRLHLISEGKHSWGV